MAGQNHDHQPDELVQDLSGDVRESVEQEAQGLTQSVVALQRLATEVIAALQENSRTTRLHTSSLDRLRLAALERNSVRFSCDYPCSRTGWVLGRVGTWVDHHLVILGFVTVSVLVMFLLSTARAQELPAQRVQPSEQPCNTPSR